MELFDEKLHKIIFDLKMSRQKILNQSLELLLEHAEKQMERTSEAIKLARFTIEDYEGEGLIISKEYQKRYNEVKLQYDRLVG